MPNNLKPITHIGLGGGVREAIEAAILECELAPGTHLVDRQLASLLHVSRTPVRDALRQLESTGLVRRPGRTGWSGWVVAGFQEQDVRELFELRRLLEPHGLKRLGNDWNAQASHRLATFFDDFPAHLEHDRYESYIARDREFHQAIVALSGNSRIIGFYEIMKKQIDRIRHFLATGYEGRMDRIVEEHRVLCSSIAVRDTDAAIAAILYHLHQGEEAIIAFAHQRGLIEDIDTVDGIEDIGMENPDGSGGQVGAIPRWLAGADSDISSSDYRLRTPKGVPNQEANSQ